MPYAPGINYQGDKYIFQGQSRAMETVGDIIQNALTQAKQTKAYRTMATDVMGMDPAKVDGMNYQDLQAMLQGKAVQAQQQEVQARTALAKAQAAKAQMDADANTGFPDFAKYLNEEMSGGAAAPAAAGPAAGLTWPPPGGAGLSLALPALPGGTVVPPVQTSGSGTGPAPGAAPTGTPGTPPPMMPAVLRALGRVGAMNPRVAAALGSKLLPSMLANTTDDQAPQMTNLNGLPVVWKRGTKEFMFDPRTAVDAKAAAAAELLQRKQAFHEQLMKNGFKPAVNSVTGEEIPDVYSDPNGKTVDLRSQVDKVAGSARPTTTPTPPPPPTKTPAAAAPRVQVKDANGKVFTVPQSQLADALKQGYTQVK